MFGSLSLVWKLIGGAALIVAVAGGIFWAGDSHGRAAVRAEFAAAREAEDERQDQANEEAQRNAAIVAAELEALRRDRDALLLELTSEAARDPDAGVCTLPLAGVLRHNAFTGNSPP